MAGSASGVSPAVCVSRGVPRVCPSRCATRGTTAPWWPGSRLVDRGGGDRFLLPDVGDGCGAGTPGQGFAFRRDLDRRQRSSDAGFRTAPEDGAIPRRKPLAPSVWIHQEMDSPAAAAQGASPGADGGCARYQWGPARDRRTFRWKFPPFDGLVHPAPIFLLLRAAHGYFCLLIREVYAVRALRRHRPAQSAISYGYQLLPLSYPLPPLQFLALGSPGGSARHPRSHEQEQRNRSH